MFCELNPIVNGAKPDEYLAEPYVTPGNIDGPDSTFYGRGGEPEGGYIFKDVEVQKGRRTYLHYRTAR